MSILPDRSLICLELLHFAETKQGVSVNAGENGIIAVQVRGPRDRVARSSELSVWSWGNCLPD
jgi:hypothetical protein